MRLHLTSVIPVFDVERVIENFGRLCIVFYDKMSESRMSRFIATDRFSLCSKQNRACEDRYALHDFANNVKYYAVFDGHGKANHNNIDNRHVVIYLSQHLHEHMEDLIAHVDDVELFSASIVNLFTKLDRHLYDHGAIAGCTCAIILDTPNCIYQINLGDSRSVIFDTGGKVISRTQDHDLSLPCEVHRVNNMGGTIRDERVNGTLALSRAFGDFDLKIVNGKYCDQGPVSCVPDIHVTPKQDEMYFILGTDGCFDGIRVSHAISTTLRSNTFGQACKNIVRNAMKDNGNDDTTVIVGRL